MPEFDINDNVDYWKKHPEAYHDYIPLPTQKKDESYGQWYALCFSKHFCCSNAICNGASFRPSKAPTCKCGRFCGTCGRFKWILIPQLPKPPQGTMTKFEDIAKLNWVEQEGEDVALFPPSFWNLWKNPVLKIEIEAGDYRIKKLGNNWILYRKHIEIGYIKK